jgi:hypothetical protein
VIYIMAGGNEDSIAIGGTLTKSKKAEKTKNNVCVGTRHKNAEINNIGLKLRCP